MPDTPTPRLGLVAPLGTDQINQGDDSLRTLVARLDAVLAPVSSGLFANRPVSTPVSPGIVDRLYHATDAFAAFRDTGTGWEIRAQTPQIVTALPSGGGLPFDGQEVYYLADATNGIVCHLRYRAGSASAYKWETVGQPPALSAFGSSSNGGSGYASAFAVTAPLAGDYEIDAGWRELRTDTAGQGRWWGIADGAAAPATEYFWQETNANRFGFGSSIRARRTGVTAGTALTMRVRGSGVGTVNWNDGWLAIRPVRVG